MMRSSVPFEFRSLLLAAGVFCSTAALAEFRCGGPLTPSQVNGFDALFQPRYDSALVKTGTTVADANWARKLSKSQISSLTVDKPRIAARATLDVAGAKFLKKALNDNAQVFVPGWIATAIGAFVPQTWVGVSADVMIQFFNGAGDAGRLSLANLAGTVGPGGVVAVVERVGKDKTGATRFIWAYTYSATLNGRPTMALLHACAADVLVTN